jgi:eukaryotic-like serine/threonine-protein kinase
MTVEELIDEFDGAWHAVEMQQTPPEIGRFLPESSHDDLLQHLEKLIAIELEYRWRRFAEACADSPTMKDARFCPPPLTDYAARFQDLLVGETFSAELVGEEYRLQCRFGNRPGHDDVLAKWGDSPSVSRVLDRIDEELQELGAAADTCVGGAPTTDFEDSVRVPDLPGFADLKLIGRGGKGLVFRAHQLLLDRTVAIKTLRTPFTASPTDVARLRKEAKLIAGVRHENLVPVYSLEQHDDQWFLVMEYVSGSDLATRLKQSVIEPKQAARWLVAAAEGIHAAHEAGILHRDVKPSNILLENDGTIRVTDFGLSRQFGDADNADNVETMLTGTRDILGTPSYVAPEQAAGKSRALKPTADVYGLGATLYHLLTGRPPFVGDMFEVLRQVRHIDPVPLQKFQPSVPKDLQTIVMQCLRKAPAERYQSARDLAQDLRRFLEEQPIAAQPLSRPAVAWRWCMRNPLPASATTLIIVMLFSILGLLFSRSLKDAKALADERGQTQQLRAALERERNANQEIYESQLRQAYLEYQQNELQYAETILDAAVPDGGREELRDWEWHHLRSVLDTSIQQWHLDVDGAEWINAVAFSPDGRYLAAGAAVPMFMDGRRNTPAGLWLIDLSTGEKVMDLGGQLLSITSIDFSPDGAQIAVVERNLGMTPISKDYFGPARIRRWSTQTFQELPSLAEDGDCDQVWFSQDGTALLAAERGRDGAGRLLVYPTSGNSDVLRFPKDTWSVQDDMSGFNARAVDGREFSWQIRKNHRHTALANEKARSAVNGHQFQATFDGDEPGVVEVRQRSANELVQTIHSGAVETVAFSPNHRHLAIAARGGEISVWDTQDWKRSLVLRGHRARVRSLAFNGAGTQLASGDWEGWLRLWDVTHDPASRTFGTAKPGARLDAFTLTETDRLLTFSATLKSVESHGLKSRQTQQLFHVPQALAGDPPGRCFRFIPELDQACFAGVGEGELKNVVTVCEWSTGQLVRHLKGHTHRIANLDAAHGLIASAAWPRGPIAVAERHRHSGELRVWDASGKCLMSIQQPGARFHRLALCPDCEHVAAATQTWRDGGEVTESVQVWEISSGRIVDSFKVNSWALGLTFSPDGRLLAAIDHDDGVLVLRQFLRHQNLPHSAAPVTGINDLRFSPTGTRLAGAGRTRIVLWDAVTGREVFHAPLTVFPSDYIFNPQVRFSAAGRMILANQADGTVRIFGERIPADAVIRVDQARDSVGQ